MARAIPLYNVNPHRPVEYNEKAIQKVIDTVGFDKHFYIVVVCFNTVKCIGYASAWKLVKNFCSKRFVIGLSSSKVIN